MISGFIGFFRYMAPEYFIHGIVDEKIDVFAFGVLLLEIITSRRAVDTASRQSIVAWVMIIMYLNLSLFRIIKSDCCFTFSRDNT